MAGGDSWLDATMEKLRQRDASVKQVHRTVEDYQRLSFVVVELQSMLFQGNAAAAVEDTVSGATLVETQSKLEQTERALKHKTSELLQLRQDALEDRQGVLAASNTLQAVQRELTASKKQVADLEQVRRDLERQVALQSAELLSLRDMQANMHDQVHLLTQESKSYVEQIVRVKSQQSATMNEMNRLIHLLSSRGTAQDQADLHKLEQSQTEHGHLIKKMTDTMQLHSHTSIPASIDHIYRSSGPPTSSCCFDGSESRIAAAGDDGSVHLWSTSSGPPISLNMSRKPLLTTSFALNGHLVLGAGMDTSVHVWSLTTQRHVRTMPGHRNKVTSAQFTADAEHVVSGGYDRTVRLWDVHTGGNTATLAAHSSVNALALSSDGDMIATGHLDKHVRLWSLSSQECIADLGNVHTKPVIGLKFIAFGTQLVTLSKDGAVNVLDIRALKPLHRIAHPSPVQSNWNEFGASPDGSMIAVGGHDGHVVVWNISGKPILQDTLRHHTSAVHSVDWSVSGRYLVSADHCGAVVQWK